MKTDERIGKIIITGQKIKKDLLSAGLLEVIIGLVFTALFSLLLLAIGPLVSEYKDAVEGINTAIKYQVIAVKLQFFVLILFCAAVPASLFGMTVYALVKYIRLRLKGFVVDVDDVNYLDSRTVRRGKHTQTLLNVHFFKYGKYATEYLFDEYFAKHKEEFYVVVTKDREPKILSIYRKSKYEYME